MTAGLIISLFAGLFLKHFICDFILQTPYQFLNKGTYGHLGGVLHSVIQAIGSVIILTIIGFNVLSLFTISWVCTVEYLVHYHIDWAKMNLNKYYNWKCDSSSQFWMLLGFDQYLHYMTYCFMIYTLV